jgi:uncharacterized membrane protein YeaQ/YmgE (transglycosylase-associated protein family)
MKITLSQIVVWLAAGALAGWLVGMLVTRSKQGFGRWGNFGVGLIGALIGGAIFRLFNIDLGLGELAVSFQDLLSAFLGSFIFLGAVWLIRRRDKTGV